MKIYYSQFENSKCVHDYATGELKEVLSELHQRILPDKPNSCAWGFFCLHPKGEQLNLGIGEKPCGRISLIIFPTKESAQANLDGCLAEGNDPLIEADDLVK